MTKALTDQIHKIFALTRQYSPVDLKFDSEIPVKSYGVTIGRTIGLFRTKYMFHERITPWVRTLHSVLFLEARFSCCWLFSWKTHIASTYMVKRHFNVARIQGLTSIISFNQIIKVAESSVNINCKITILSNKINALLIKKTCLFSKYFTF